MKRPKKQTTPRERFLQAECDRMVEVVGAARESVYVLAKYKSTPVAVEQLLWKIANTLARLDFHRRNPERSRSSAAGSIDGCEPFPRPQEPGPPPLEST